MKNGKLLLTGVGPGDKELITLRALRALKEADIIAVPLMRSGARTAFDIIEEYARDKEIMELLMPMTRDEQRLSENYAAVADALSEKLRDGRDIAFITLGDVSVYSSCAQIERLIAARGYETELIPGVTSFCAAAARLKVPLCERDEPLMILPASASETGDALSLKGTKVLMKAGGSMGAVLEMLEKSDAAKKAVMAERCGMEGERLYYNLADTEDEISYFSTIIVKDRFYG